MPPDGEQTRPRYLTDPDALKALTHPLRQRMLTRLHSQGPATSAELATEFGEDRGATSYHLRQLAKHGYIEVDDARSAGRRKYWRAVPQDVRLPDPRGVDPATSALADELGRQWTHAGLDKLARHFAAQGADPGWDAAAMHSHSTRRMTREELARFGEEYIAFLNRWGRPAEEAPPDAEPVYVMMSAFRMPADPS